MSRPEFSPTISLGNLIQMAVLIVAMAGGWALMRADLDHLGGRLTTQRDVVRDMEMRVRVLEAERARADERFSNILALLSRIDGRLARIEGGKR